MAERRMNPTASRGGPAHGGEGGGRGGGGGWGGRGEPTCFVFPLFSFVWWFCFPFGPFSPLWSLILSISRFTHRSPSPPVGLLLVGPLQFFPLREPGHHAPPARRPVPPDGSPAHQVF